MTSGKRWFHGTKTKFDEFDTKFIGIGNDELGSGFYFTDEVETARGYTFSYDSDEGYLIEAEVDIKKPLAANAQLSREDIRGILLGSPNLEDTLWNFGDLSSEPQDRVLNTAVDIYAAMNDGDDVLALLNAINNDFWSGHEADFLEQVTAVTGYDGFYREKGDQMHAVVWNPNQISIKEVTQVMKEAFKP